MRGEGGFVPLKAGTVSNQSDNAAQGGVLSAFRGGQQEEANRAGALAGLLKRL